MLQCTSITLYVTHCAISVTVRSNVCVCVCVWMTYVGLPWLHQRGYVLCGYSYTHAHTQLCRVVCFAMVTTICTSEDRDTCLYVHLSKSLPMNAWSKGVTVTCKYIIVAGSTMVPACHVLELTIGRIRLWWSVTLTDSLVHWFIGLLVSKECLKQL